MVERIRILGRGLLCWVLTDSLEIVSKLYHQAAVCLFNERLAKAKTAEIQIKQLEMFAFALGCLGCRCITIVWPFLRFNSLRLMRCGLSSCDYHIPQVRASYRLEQRTGRVSDHWRWITNHASSSWIELMIAVEGLSVLHCPWKAWAWKVELARLYRVLTKL